MDLFDQYLFDELAAMYAKKNLSADEQEELYIRFGNLDHLEQVHPYLYAMRFFGWGVPAEPDKVLKELKRMKELSGDDPVLTGLYEDLLLSAGKGNASSRENLKKAADLGYSNVHLKTKTSLPNTPSSVLGKNGPEHEAKPAAKPEPKPAARTVPEKPKEVPKVVVKKIEFESQGRIANAFDTMDVDYLCAKVHVEPADVPRKIVVTSRIYTSAGKPQSDEIVNDFTLNPGSRWFKTKGWGSKNVGSYPAGKYRWVIRISDTGFESENTFEILAHGAVSEVRVKKVALFASKLSGALSADTERYQTSFSARTLECLYAKAEIYEPGRDIRVKSTLKMENLDTGSVFHEVNYIHEVKHNYVSIWKGVGYDQPGKWKAGHYRYTWTLGSSKFEGTFTVT